MKKLICIFLSILICVITTGCAGKTTNANNVSWPLKEINVVYDKYDNMMQQVLLNEQTGEYYITNYTWVMRDNAWVCIDSNTTVLKANNDTEYTPSTSINIFYKTSLANGPIVLLDNSEVRVSIVEYLDAASWWEFGYKIKIENKGVRLFTVTFDNVAILDINCKPMFSVEHIEGGHTAYINLAWDTDSLKRACIPYLDNVAFTVRVFDNADWTKPALYGTNILIKH
jgi:hypothetical protein